MFLTEEQVVFKNYLYYGDGETIIFEEFSCT